LALDHDDPTIDAAFILAIRHQREAEYAEPDDV
jgi:hypothetical protein